MNENEPCCRVVARSNDRVLRFALWMYYKRQATGFASYAEFLVWYNGMTREERSAFAHDIASQG